MEKITVVAYCVTYEGAHFRGLSSDTDDREVELILTGTEQEIVTFLLENFSYGNDDPDEPEYTTLADMSQGIRDYDVQIFDGCGAILKITVGNNVVLDVLNEHAVQSELNWTKVDPITLDETIVADDNYINKQIHKLHKAGKLPPR